MGGQLPYIFKQSVHFDSILCLKMLSLSVRGHFICIKMEYNKKNSYLCGIILFKLNKHNIR